MTQTSNNSTSWAFTDNGNEGSITGSGNYAKNGKQLTTARAGFTETCGASVATILEKVNANTTIVNGIQQEQVNGFGRFAYNSNQDDIVLATPEYEGYQKSAVVNGEYSIRLLATINDVNISNSSEYKYLGFELSKNGGETYKKFYTDYVYNSVLATKDGGEQITYTAGELGGAYIYALIIDGISVETGTTLTVRAFAVDQAGNTLYGTAATIALAGIN